ncbi:DUF2711 family protein [Cytobacillus sp. FJAT-53684]|uniref:DUF2711 family protein n=1 Tax=Cytobacillus mangrovibacter TaxID=3299024 RepID=A0ABW6K0Y3_9BACI
MTKVRVLPEPHRYAICARADIPIKEFYKGVFEEVYIFFHPFIKPKTIDYDLFNPNTYPSKNEIRDNCEMITWEKFQSLAGVDSLKQLDTGLRTIILGLKKEYQDVQSARLILETCEKERIIQPTEGFFPEFVMNHLLKSIKTIGHDWIWLGDEFCTERKLEYIDDLISDNNVLGERKNLFTHDSSILITTHWDSHFSLLCSNRDTVKYLVDLCGLEGFFCTEKTEIYWCVP